VTAPIKAGQQIGTASVTEGGKPVTTIPIVAAADVVKSASLTKRLLSLF
jgi:penicillin-binding protein